MIEVHFNRPAYVYVWFKVTLTIERPAPSRPTMRSW